MDVKTVNVIVKNNSQQFSMVNPLIDHRNDVKMLKNFALKQLACGSWFHLSFEYPNVISMVNNSTYHGKLLSIC